MTVPDLVVEVGYGSTWKTEPASISWTDETDRVLFRDRVVCRRGASSARGKTDVGTAAFSLENNDRRFDPTHTAGSLYGSLKPGVPVRVRATTGTSSASDALLLETGDRLLLETGDAILLETGTATSTVLWSGTIPAWPQRYEKPKHSWVPVSAYDRFDKLSRAKIPRSVLEAEVLADSPVGYWTLDDASGDVMVDRSGNGLDGTFTSGTTRLAGEIDGTPALIFDGEHVGSVGLPLPDASTLTIGALIDLSDADLADGDVLAIGEFSSPGALQFFAIEVVTAATKTVRIFHHGKFKGRALVANSLSATFTATVPRYVTVRANVQVIGGSRDYWVDGVELADSALPAPSYTTASYGIRVGGSQSSGNFVGGLAHVSAHDSMLSAARIAAYSAAALAPLDGDRSDERITWVLDEIGWPSNLRDLSTGRSLLGEAQIHPGDGALEYLRLIESTEDGRVFIGPDGSLVFHDRYWRYLEAAATVSQFTFTDQDGDQGYAQFQLDLDDELLVNVARFTRRDGVEQVATDTTSIDLYGEAEEQRSNLLSTTDAQVRSLAEWAVATKSTPLPRVPSIRIPLHRYSAADQSTVLGLDLGHRVTVHRTPQGVGSQIALDFLVDGIAHEVGVKEWWVDLFVSPVPEDTAELFLLGTSTLGGTHILAH